MLFRSDRQKGISKLKLERDSKIHFNLPRDNVARLLFCAGLSNLNFSVTQPMRSGTGVPDYKEERHKQGVVAAVRAAFL